MNGPLQNGRYNPCKDCQSRYPGCSAKCKKPKFLEWQAEQEKIRQNRKRYNSPIWMHGDRDPRRK